MRFFGRKKKKEEEEFDSRKKTFLRSPDEKGKVPKDKDFKDLKPEFKKKRKEPPKPWGKKERFLVAVFLVGTVVVSAFLSASSRAWKLPNIPRLKIPKLSLFGDDTIILENKNRSKTADLDKQQKIKNEFENITNKLTGVYGLYVIDLDTGISFGVNENEDFQAASLIKLPVMTGMYLSGESGFNLNSKYILKASDKVAGAGSLYAKPNGYEITYRSLLKLMGKQSDNTAFRICRNYLGDDKINQIAKSIGMTNTDIVDNNTTPKDIGTFFEGLWNGNIIDKADQEELLSNLTDTLYEDWIAAGVPEGIRVAHKYGREVHVLNDAGIVYANKPFVIVILSKGIADAETEGLYPKITEMVYSRLEGI